jgi:hypothetical protein
MAREAGEGLAVVAVRRMIVAGNLNNRTKTQGEATPILATGIHFQGAILTYGLILVMIEIGLTVVMHRGGRGSIIRGTDTRDLVLIPTVEERHHNSVSCSKIRVTRIYLSALSMSQVRQVIRRSKLVMIPNLNRQFQRFSNPKKLAKPKWTKDNQVKVVSLFASDAINLVMENLNAKQSYYVIFALVTNILLAVARF